MNTYKILHDISTENDLKNSCNLKKAQVKRIIKNRLRPSQCLSSKTVGTMLKITELFIQDIVLR